MFRSTLIAALLLTGFGAYAQTTSPGLGSWTALNLRGKISGPFYFMFETQARSDAFYNKFFYHEFKGGGGLNLNKSFAIFAGVGKYDTYTKNGGNFEGPRTANEVRTWFEGTIKDHIGRVFFEHRFRIEQRFFTTGYRNRFRYRLGIAVPINHKKMEDKTFYLSTFNELFLTNTEPYFERNRFFVGAGYRIKPATIQLGWVNQLDYKLTTGGVAKNFLQLTISIDFGKEPPTRLPFEEG
jgi:hypothetical protein